MEIILYCGGETMKTPCQFCGIDLKLDPSDIYSETNYKKIVFHVWQHHQEEGVSLRTTLRCGPSNVRSEEE